MKYQEIKHILEDSLTNSKKKKMLPKILHDKKFLPNSAIDVLIKHFAYWLSIEFPEANNLKDGLKPGEKQEKNTLTINGEKFYLDKNMTEKEIQKMIQKRFNSIPKIMPCIEITKIIKNT